MTGTPRIWPIVLILAIFSTPLVIMYLYHVIDSVASPDPGSLIPGPSVPTSVRQLTG